MEAKMWKDDQQNPLSDDTKKATIISLLQELYGIEAANKVDFFVAKENRRFASWMKLTFRQTKNVHYLQRGKHPIMKSD